MGREDKMIEASKADSARKVQYVKEIIDNMVEMGIAAIEKPYPSEIKYTYL